MRVAPSSRVKAHFDRLSPAYAGNFAGPASGKRHAFRARAEIVAGLVGGRLGALLDVACGTGEVTAAALRAGRFTSAVVNDVSAPMLDAARRQLRPLENGLEMEYRQADVFAMDVGTRRFDVILCLGLIAHTGRLPDLCAALGRLLAPGGVIVLQTSIATHPGMRIVRALSDRRFERRAGYRLAYFSLDDIAGACAASALAISDVTRYVVGVPFGDRIWPRGNYWIERAFRPLAAKWGAEAICALTKRAAA